MSNIITKTHKTVNNWWLYTIMGILLIAGGIYVFQTPEESYLGLSFLFSIIIFINGLFDIVFSVKNRKFLKSWGWFLAEGIFKTAIGYILIANPDLTMNVLPYLLGFYVLSSGGSIISSALDLKSYYVKGWGYVMALGVLTVILSFIILYQPSVGAASIVAITGLSFISLGVAQIALSLKLRKVKKFVSKSIQDLKTKIREEYNNLEKELEGVE